MNLWHSAPLLILLLFGGHAIADYGLQSSYMAEHKVRKEGNPDWFVTLFAHSLIHGVFVLIIALFFLHLVGHSINKAIFFASFLGWAETISHFVIDYRKGQGRFSYRTDQELHYNCKLMWFAFLVSMPL